MSIKFKPVFYNIFVLFSIFISLVSFNAQAMGYTYDALGRLQSASSTSSLTNYYQYDGANNLVSISQISTAPLVVNNISPNYGQIGEQVTITGTGFDPINTNDTVTFNGTSAGVLSATSTSLLVQIPFGATTGYVNVSTTSASTTSPSVFTVTTYGQAPIISSFSPAIVVIGNTVTLTGANLNPLVGGTILFVNGEIVFPQTISNTSITFTAPYLDGAGNVTVTTPFGMASTTVLLDVLPITFSGATFENNLTLPVNTATNFSTTSTSTSAYTLLNFYANKGDYKTVYITLPNTTQLTAYIYDQYGNQLLDKTVSKSATYFLDSSVHFFVAPQSGYYYLVINDHYGAPRTIQAMVVTDSVLSGSLTTISPPSQYQSVRTLFQPTANGDLNVGVYNTTAPSTTPSFYVFTNNQAASVSTIASCQNSIDLTCSLDFTGVVGNTYEIEYTSASVINFQSQGNTPYTLTTNNTTYTLANYGQNIEIPATIAANYGYDLILSNISATPNTTSSTTISLLDSNRNVITTSIVNRTRVYPGSTYTSVFSIAPNKYPPGSYTFRINPTNGDLLSANIDLIPEPINSLAINGSAVSMNTTSDGQNQYYQFTATAGENIGITFYGLTSDYSNAEATFSLFYNGTAISGTGSCLASIGSCDMNYRNLSAGTYILVFNGSYVNDNYKWSGNVISTQDYDSTFSLGTDTNMVLGYSQNQQYDFSGNSGDYFGLVIDKNGTVSNYENFYIKNDAWGTVFTSGTSPNYFYENENQGFNFGPVSATANYHLYIDPEYGLPDSNGITLLKVPNTTLTMNATAVNLQSALKAINIYANFSGTAGEAVTFHISGITRTAWTGYGGSLTTYIYNPGYTQSILTSVSCANATSCSVSMTLPTTGQYTIELKNADYGSTTGTNASDLSANFSVTSP